MKLVASSFHPLANVGADDGLGKRIGKMFSNHAQNASPESLWENPHFIDTLEQYTKDDWEIKSIQPLIYGEGRTHHIGQGESAYGYSYTKGFYVFWEKEAQSAEEHKAYFDSMRLKVHGAEKVAQLKEQRGEDEQRLAEQQKELEEKNRLVNDFETLSGDEKWMFENYFYADFSNRGADKSKRMTAYMAWSSKGKPSIEKLVGEIDPNKRRQCFKLFKEIYKTRDMVDQATDQNYEQWIAKFIEIKSKES